MLRNDLPRGDLRVKSWEPLLFTGVACYSENMRYLAPRRPLIWTMKIDLHFKKPLRYPHYFYLPRFHCSLVEMLFQT